jgi:hypothetical protein
VEELRFRIEFAANLLIILKEQGRVDVQYLPEYEEIIWRLINCLSQDLKTSDISAVQQLGLLHSFGLIGKESQLGCFSNILVKVRDEGLLSEFVINNPNYFREDFLQELYEHLTIAIKYTYPERRDECLQILN